MYGLNYEGLKKRETYDEIVEYIQNKQEKIKYPDRTAKQLRNSPKISNLLDGDGDGYLQTEQAEKTKMMQAAVATELKKFTMENNKTLKVEAIKYDMASTDYDGLFDEDYEKEEEIGIQFEEEEKKEKDEKLINEADEMLKRVIERGIKYVADEESNYEFLDSEEEKEQEKEKLKSAKNLLKSVYEKSISSLTEKKIEEEEAPVAVKEEIKKIESFIESVKPRSAAIKPRSTAKARSRSRKGTRMETDDPEENLPRRASSRAPEVRREIASGSSSRPAYDVPPTTTNPRRETKDPNKKSYYTQMSLPNLKKIVKDLDIPFEEEKGGKKITKQQLLNLIYEKKNIV